MTPVLRVFRIPFSTNVERVSLALAHKGLEVEWADLDPVDRSPVERSAVSRSSRAGRQRRVVADSTVILRYLEELQPAPALFPNDEARRAELERLPRLVRPGLEEAAERDRGRAGQAGSGPGADRRAGSRADRSLNVFEQMLAGRDYLFGEFSAADCAAFPFLKYGVLYDEADSEEFHVILREHLALDGRYPRVEAWIRRVDARPRA